MKYIKLLFLLLIVNTAIKAQLSVKASVDHLKNDGVDTLGNITLAVSGSTAPYTYTWMPGNINTKDLSNIHAGSYTVTVKSASNQTYTAVYSLKYKTDWTNLDRCYFRNDSLVSNSTNYSRAVSKNTLAANTDGWFEYVLDDLPNNVYYIGFLDSISPNLATYTDIDYGMYLWIGGSTKYIYSYENGTTSYLGIPKIGDILRVERIGNVINYKFNGIVVRTQTVSGISSKNLKLKAVLLNSNRVLNVGCSFNQNGNVAFPNMVNVTPLIKHLSSTGSNDGSIKVTPEVSGSYTYTWQPGGANTSSVTSLALGQYEVSVEDADHNISSKYYNVGYKADWTNLDRCYFRNDSLVSNSTNYSRAVSKNTLAANTDGWFEYVLDDLPNNVYYIGFLDSISPNLATYTDIDYGMYLWIGGSTKYIYSYENGTTSYLGIPKTGDILRVERIGNVINYKINGAIARTLTVSGISSKNLKLKAVLLNSNRVVNVGCSFNQNGNAAFPNMVNVTPLIKHLSSTGSNDGSIKVTPEVSGSYTYTWQPGGANTTTLTSLALGQYKVSVEDTDHNISNKYYNVGYKADWINIDGATIRNDSLFSTNTGKYCTAISKNTLMPYQDGWFEFVINNFYSNQYFIGLVDSIAPFLNINMSDIDYGFRFPSGPSIGSWENNVTTAWINYAANIGDIMRIERVGNVINFKINGATVRTVTNSGISQKALKLKANLFYGITLSNVGCSFYPEGNVTFPNLLNVIPVIKHVSGINTNNGSIKVSPDIQVNYTYTWQPVNQTTSQINNLQTGSYKLSVEDSLQDISNKYYNVGYKTDWNCNYKCFLRNDSLVSTSIYGNDFSRAITKNELPANTDGWFEIELNPLSSTALSYFVGFLDSAYSATNVHSDIDYGFWVAKDQVSHYENGSIYWYGNVYKKGDILRIERIGNTIIYKLNGVVLRTTTVSGISGKKLKIKAEMPVGLYLANVGCSFAVPFSTNIVTASDARNSAMNLPNGQVKVRMQGSVPPYNVYVNNVYYSQDTVLNLPSGPYVVKVTDSYGNTATNTCTVANAVWWKTVTNLTNTSNHILSKSSGSSNAWDAGAFSRNVLPAKQDGWMEYAVPSGTAITMAFGLSDVNTDNTDNTMKVGYSISNNTLTIKSGSVALYTGTVQPGDTLKISRTDTIYKFYKNRSLIYTNTSGTLVDKTKDLFIDVAMYKNNYTAGAFRASFFIPTVQLAISKTNPTYDNPNTGVIAIQPYNGISPYQISWTSLSSSQNVLTGLAPGDYPLVVTDSINDTLKTVISVGVKNNWRINKNLSIAADTFNVVKNGNDSTGVLLSYNTLFSDENGWTETVISNKQQTFAFGFIGGSSDDLDANYSTPYISDTQLNRKMQYADSASRGLYSVSAYTNNPNYTETHIVKFDNGIVTPLFKGYNPAYTTPITFAAGDVFRMERTNGTITLKKNGQVVATENFVSSSQTLINAYLFNSKKVILSSPAAYAAAGNNFSHVAIPYLKCLADGTYNWNYSRTFDENGNIITEAKQYMDKLGRTIQSQSKVFSKNTTLVSEPLYDAYGRAVGQTLPAPSFNSALCYVDDFVTNQSNQTYTWQDFDKVNATGAAGEIYNPKPVGYATRGTLGWYYSNSNTDEALVDASSYPYNRVEYYNDPLGRPKKIAGVGAAHNMGSGHETKMLYMSTANCISNANQNELQFVFPNGSYELAYDFTSPNYSINGQTNVKNRNLTLFKTVALDADGKDQITYTNSSGQVVATCVTGDDPNTCGQNIKIIQSIFNTTQTDKEAIQVYIPKGKTNTLKFYDASTNGGQVSPVIKDLLSGATLTEGTDYTYNTSTKYITFTGSYAGSSGLANRLLYLSLSYNWASGFTPNSSLTYNIVSEYMVNLTQWTLYFYDRKGRLLSTVSPNDVACQTPVTKSQTTTAHGDHAFTCNSSSQDICNISISNSGSGTKEGILVVSPEAFKINALATTSLSSDIVFMSDSVKLGIDTVIPTYSGTVLADSLVNLIDTAYTNHMPMYSDSTLRALIDSQLVVPGILAGKAIRYTGQYNIYLNKTSGNVLMSQHPSFDFTVSYDSVGVPIIKNNLLWPSLTLIKAADIEGASSISVQTQNIKLKFLGFDIFHPDSLYEPCAGNVYAGKIGPLLNAITQNIGVVTNLNVFNYGSPVNLNFYTRYTYDEYDRLMASQTQDEGRVDYMYDQKEDKLLFTQNDKQRANGGKFSCIVYDKLGRAIVTGEYDPNNGGSTGGGTNPLQFQTYTDYFVNQVSPNSGYTSTGYIADNNLNTYNDGHIFESTHIIYDDAEDMSSYATGYQQRYTAAKVAKTYNDNGTTWYSYDELGRQTWVIQDLNGLGTKTMDYTYDFRGKLLTSQYQKLNSSESFTHVYTYDADERIQNVQVKQNPSSSYTQAALYQYYIHGPLKRTVLGNNLQGMDYVYGIAGELKSLNNPMAANTSQDPGQDGYSSGSNSSVKADVFGFTLDYYNGDYSRSGTNIISYTGSSFASGNTSYTGLIKAMRWKTTLPSGATNNFGGSPLMYEYNYDDMYRLSDAQFGTASVSGGNISFSTTNDYKLNNIGYDKNGNITGLKRYKQALSGAAQLMDDLSYNYHSTMKNRLLQVQDNSSSSLAADFDLPNQTNSSNYTYNSIGELISDAQEDKGYEYNASGLTTRVYKLSNSNNIATFSYNDKGQRHSKTSYNSSGVAQKITYYVYDAGGAQIATYEHDLTVSGSSPQVKDYMVYGAGRLGIYDIAGQKIYFELSDHLGNTRAVVTETSGQAEVVSFTDYYPHGGVLPGQQYTSSLAYRYAYQGQEKDAETGLINFELRQYDPRIARWYNPDPMGQHHSPYLAMGNNPVSSIDPDGGWDGYGGDDAFRDYMYHGGTNGVDHSWFFANPFQRDMMQTVFGTSYESQDRERVMDNMALGEGYRAKDGSLYSLKGNQITRTTYQTINVGTDMFGGWSYEKSNSEIVGVANTYTGTPIETQALEFIIGLGQGGVQLAKDGLHTVKGVFTGETWLNVGTTLKNVGQVYVNAIDHDMESMDWERWEQNYRLTKTYIENLTPRSAGYGVGYIGIGLLMDKFPTVGGKLTYKMPYIGANSKLFGAGIKFKKLDFSTKGILNKNNYVRMGWQMTGNQTLRFGVRFGANPKYLKTKSSFGIGFNSVLYNSPLGHGLGSLLKIRLTE